MSPSLDSVSPRELVHHILRKPDQAWIIRESVDVSEIDGPRSSSHSQYLFKVHFKERACTCLLTCAFRYPDGDETHSGSPTIHSHLRLGGEIVSFDGRVAKDLIWAVESAFFSARFEVYDATAQFYRAVIHRGESTLLTFGGTEQFVSETGIPITAQYTRRENFSGVFARVTYSDCSPVELFIPEDVAADEEKPNAEDAEEINQLIARLDQRVSEENEEDLADSDSEHIEAVPPEALIEVEEAHLNDDAELLQALYDRIMTGLRTVVEPERDFRVWNQLRALSSSEFLILFSGMEQHRNFDIAWSVPGIDFFVAALVASGVDVNELGDLPLDSDQCSRLACATGLELGIRSTDTPAFVQAAFNLSLHLFKSSPESIGLLWRSLEWRLPENPQGLLETAMQVLSSSQMDRKYCLIALRLLSFEADRLLSAPENTKIREWTHFLRAQINNVPAERCLAPSAALIQAAFDGYQLFSSGAAIELATATLLNADRFTGDLSLAVEELAPLIDHISNLREQGEVPLVLLSRQHIFLDVLGPLLSYLKPGWMGLEFRAPTVAALASGIEAGNYDLLPVLADALEDRSYKDAFVLRYCRYTHRHLASHDWLTDEILGRSPNTT